MFEFPERKLKGLGSFSPTSVLWKACSWDSQPYVRERFCWLPSSLAFSLCFGECSNLPTAAACFGAVLLLWGWRGWEHSKPLGPTRGCLFSLAELHRGKTSSSVGHTVVGPGPMLGKAQLFPVWSRDCFRSCVLFLGGLLLYTQR